MKKAVIITGSKQYIVSEGDELLVDLIKSDKKTIDFEDVLLIFGENKTSVGTPNVKGAKVSAEIVDSAVKQDKVTSIRYKAKKRVRKIKGHRQSLTKIKIKSIKVS
ncbi:50S ribosomal protein L21 [Candidatus Saccharibacteria bacterium]|nr:50S ribosomal protein L21 [Candidatus Saccharibacteria bacterium]